MTSAISAEEQEAPPAETAAIPAEMPPAEPGEDEAPPPVRPGASYHIYGEHRTYAEHRRAPR